MGPGPQRTKFQALGTTEEAPAGKPGRSPAPSVVIDPAKGGGFRAFIMKICGASIGERLFEKKLNSGEVQENYRYYDKNSYIHPIS